MSEQHRPDGTPPDIAAPATAADADEPTVLTRPVRHPEVGEQTVDLLGRPSATMPVLPAPAPQDGPGQAAPAPSPDEAAPREVAPDEAVPDEAVPDEAAAPAAAGAAGSRTAQEALQAQPAEVGPVQQSPVPEGAVPEGAVPERRVAVRRADDRPGDEGTGGAGDDPAQAAPWRRLSSAGALIWVLIALFGFTLVVQLRSNDTDQGLSTMRQEDLVRILSDLEEREIRLNSEISSLEESRRQLTSGVQGRQAALEEAERRADELGLLSGTLPGRGPGLEIQIRPGGEPIKASAILNTVQELRGADGEAMQIAGANGAVVRVVASTAFVDGDGGAVLVDGVRLTGPYVLTVIGAPQTMETALNIPGGVVASVDDAGGTVIAEQRKAVEVTAVREATNLQYARPVS